MHTDQNENHSATDWFKIGDYYKNRNNLDKAIEAFAQAKLLLMAEIGECFTRLGKLEEAAIMFEDILDVNSRDLRATMGIGIVRLLEENFPDAEAAFNNVLHFTPRNSKALCGLGMAKKGLGKKEEASALFRKTIDIDPDNKSAIISLANELTQQGKKDEAVMIMKNFLARNPDDDEIASLIRELGPTVTSSPQQPAATVEATPITPELLQRLSRDYQTDPYNRTFVLDLARALHKSGYVNDARNICAVYLQRYPSDADVLMAQTTF